MQPGLVASEPGRLEYENWLSHLLNLFEPNSLICKKGKIIPTFLDCYDELEIINRKGMVVKTTTHTTHIMVQVSF